MDLTLVLAPGGDRLLLAELDGVWSLPAVEVEPDEKWWRETARVNRALRKGLGLDAVVLRCAGEHVFLMESLGASAEPPDRHRWVSAAELAELKIASDARELCEAALGGAYPPNPAAPWTARGWFGAAEKWIETELARLGRQTTGPVEQWRNAGYTSCLLRVETRAGRVWFKACSEGMPYEPALTHAVAAHVRGFAPRVLAIDAERRFMLLEDFRGRKLAQVEDASTRQALLRVLLERMARLQRDFATRSGELFALGLPDWRPETLRRVMLLALESLAGEPRFNTGPEYSAALERAQSVLPALDEMARELAGLGVPCSLSHGDFHGGTGTATSGNILTDGRDFCVLDWTFAGVVHPFTVLNVALSGERDPTAREKLRAHYLACWSDLASPEDLERASRLAQPVGHFCDLLGHAGQLRIATEPWEQRQDRDAILWACRLVAREVEALERER